MNLRVFASKFLVSALFVLATFIAAPAYAVDCSFLGADFHPATDKDQVVIDKILKAGTCYNPATPGISATAEAAKKYLLSIASGIRNSKAPPDWAHIQPLNDSFAICAAHFLAAYIKAYGPVNVVSAFRCGPRTDPRLSCNRSENGNAGGATNSNHQIGMAVDINPNGGNSSYNTLKSFSLANPGYGIQFPWPFYAGSIDKNHMEATNRSTGACDGVPGTPVITGPAADPSTTPSASSAAPTAALANMMRTMFTPTPPPIAPAPVQPAYNPTSYFPPTPSASGTITIDSNPPPSPAPVSDLITAIAGGDTSKSTTTATATGTAITLINALGNVAGLQPNGSKPVPTGTSSIAVASLTPNNTFTSGDLRNGQTQAPVYRNYSSTFIILEQLKQTLLRLLAILKPFGGKTTKPTPAANVTTTYMD